MGTPLWPSSHRVFYVRFGNLMGQDLEEMVLSLSGLSS